MERPDRCVIGALFCPIPHQKYFTQRVKMLPMVFLAFPARTCQKPRPCPMPDSKAGPPQYHSIEDYCTAAFWIMPPCWPDRFSAKPSAGNAPAASNTTHGPLGKFAPLAYQLPWSRQRRRLLQRTERKTTGNKKVRCGGLSYHFPSRFKWRMPRGPGFGSI